jgi:thioesterase domain-containing protein
MPVLTRSAAQPGANGAGKHDEDDVFVFPTTVAQQSFWYLNLLQPGNPAYNIAVRFHLQGKLRVEHLERALNEVVRRHESLQSVFTVVDGVLMMVISPRVVIKLRRDDLRGVDARYRVERAREMAVDEGRARFDLRKGPLIRARLLQLGEEEHILLVTIHHIVSDGWSVGVLTRELGTIYDACSQEADSPLPELPLQYGDFAVWEEQWLASSALEEQIGYWVRQLADLPALELPTDRPRPPMKTFNGHIESILLPRVLTDSLEAQCAREGATLFTLMLAVFKLLLQGRTGLSDVCVGSVLAGRSRLELEPLIGLFINSVVLRTNLAGDPSFRELLGRVRDTVLQAVANQDAPFERVVKALDPKRDPSRHPFFQVNFIFQRDFVQPVQAAGLTLTPIPSVSPGAIYDLNFFLVERAEGWRASCEFNTDLYDAATIRRMLAHYQGLLEEAAADPGRRISEFHLRFPEETAPPTPPEVAARGTITRDREQTRSTAVPFVAPRDPVEARLAAMWEQILGVQRISVTADFFDSSGDSLLAAKLLAQIERAFGEQLSLPTLMQSPTIESLAIRIKTGKVTTGPDGRHGADGDAPGLNDEQWIDPDEQIFPMRREGKGPPLLIVDAGPFHRPLVRRLGSEQAVYGAVLPKLSSLPEKFTLHDIAANLTDALCASSVQAPYYLAGWCHAGLIAYEVAQQLRARGKEVALLVLFDTNSPAYIRGFRKWWKLPIRLYIKLEKWWYYFRKLSGIHLGSAWRTFWERSQKVQGPRVVDAARKRRHSDKEIEEPLTFSWQMQYHAAAEYDPKPCDWPLVLFRSRALQTGWFRDPEMGWGKLARGGLKVFEMAGEHDTMFMEPDVQELAALVKHSMRT